MTTDLRIGVIGMGARSDLASLAHRPGEGSRVTAVADPAERGRDLARERFGEDVATARSVEELRAEHEVDAVMIHAPDFAHAGIARQTLAAGIPTFLSLIHISEPTRRLRGSRMPSSA